MEKTKKPFDLTIEELTEAGRAASAEAVAIARSKGVPVAGKEARCIGSAELSKLQSLGTKSGVKTG